MRSLVATALAAALASGTLTGCTGDIGEPETQEPSGGSTTGGDPVAQAITPGPAGVRKLTARQYVNSIRVLLGSGAGDKAVELMATADPPFDATLNGFDSIGAANFSVSPPGVEQLEKFAREIARVVRDTGGFADLVPCAPSGPADAACHEKFVTAFGRVAWRRSLDEAEVALLTSVAQFAANYEDVNDFDEGVFYALTAILQSPQFMYITELGDGSSSDPTRQRLTDLELGARLSFFLLEQTPDADTLDQIENDGLESEEKVRALAKKLVSRAEAKAALAGFYSEVYRLRELKTDITKNPTKFPMWNDALRAAMEQETLKLVDFVVWQQNGDAREIIDAPYTFINADLAPIYDMPPPASGWAKVTLPAMQQRAGFLGHASFAARLSTADRTSPTRRGLFVQQTLLCNEIPPPPPGVVTEIPPDDPGTPKTIKEKLTEHQTNDTCRACHELLDNIGFALERFDPVGHYRTTDAGKTIDTSTTVKDIGEFDSAMGLGALLREDPRGPRCIMKNLFRHSMGHLETEGEDPALEEIEKGFVDSGYKIQDLLVEIVASPAFALVSEPK